MQTKAALDLDMYSDLTVAAAVLIPMSLRLQLSGVNVERFFGNFGVSCGELREPQHRLPIGAVRGIWETAAREAKDPMFGLHAGLMAGPSGPEWLPGLEGSQRNMLEAARACCRCFSMLSSCMYSRVEHWSGGIRFVKERCPEGNTTSEDLRHVIEFLVAVACSFCRQFDVSGASNWSVSFPHDAPANAAAMERALGCPIRFGEAAGFSVELPAADWTSICPAEPPHPFILRAHQTLSELIANGASASLPAMARAMALSSRTLQRRLGELRTSYHLLVDEVRSDQARLLLGSSELTVSEVAKRLGFADSVAFRRAFKRWTGDTPARYRCKSKDCLTPVAERSGDEAQFDFAHAVAARNAESSLAEPGW